MHRFFNTRATYPIDKRLYYLKKLKQVILLREKDIIEALKLDFNKPAFETYTTEIYMVLEELQTAIKGLKKWARPKSHVAPFPLLGTHKVSPIPYGVCAIFSPYNYPFQLALSPLIGAVAAGNCVVLKPSEYTLHTTKLLKQLLKQVFPSYYVCVIEGPCSVATRLLKQPLDYIFFTGSTKVGQVVMQEAAKTLTPVTLELGGKNPCIVDYDSNLPLAAKRIAWGKFLNAGQTCVAPDYILVHEAVRQPFLQLLKQEIQKMFRSKEAFPSMIHEQHYVKVLKCIDEDKIYHGGHFDADSLYIEPTILHPVSLQDECMQEEIFGPVLPVLSFNKLSSAIETVKRFPKPLACYIFSNDRHRTSHLLKYLDFGGGAINDTILHLTHPKVPFGGIGFSGMGNYHGWYSFNTFSHYQTVLYSKSIELPLRYPPYQDKVKLIRQYIRTKHLKKRG